MNDEFLSRMRLMNQKLPLDSIRNKRILIVGCGAVGVSALPILINVGFSFLYLIDIDKFEKSNFAKTSMVLDFPEDFGKPKAESTALHGQNAMIDGGICIGKTLNVFDVGPIFIRQFDYVISALDNYNARVYLNRICIEADVPIFEGGTSGLYAVERTYNHKGGCFLCLKETPPRHNSTVGCGMQYSFDVSEGEIPSCQISSTIAAGMIVNDLVRASCDYKMKFNHVHYFDGDNFSFMDHPIFQEPNCPCCNQTSKIKDSIYMLDGDVAHTTVREFLEKVEKILDEPCFAYLPESFICDDICPECGKKRIINKPEHRVNRNDIYCKEHFSSSKPTEHIPNELKSISMSICDTYLDLSMLELGLPYGGVLTVFGEEKHIKVSMKNDMEQLFSKEQIRNDVLTQYSTNR
ncbi:MAG: ThiF family adenylyltransferase [Lachnospiraceae bacterium]|nr:ThiF family adenylyltransferase [Lachnospiraceae bacterium]